MASPGSASIKAQIAYRDGQIRALRESIEVLEREIEILQRQCAHKKTKYHPDASGNNDWEDECLVCGARGKHLGK